MREPLRERATRHNVALGHEAGTAVTTRKRLKNLYYSMLIGTVMVVPGLGAVLLGYAAPLDRSSMISLIASVDVGIMLLFVALFRCPRCHASLLAWTHALLNASGSCNCPRCGLDLDRER